MKTVATLLAPSFALALDNLAGLFAASSRSVRN
jgi:hypothetical protein